MSTHTLSTYPEHFLFCFFETVYCMSVLFNVQPQIRVIIPQPPPTFSSSCAGRALYLAFSFGDPCKRLGSATVYVLSCSFLLCLRFF